MQLPALFRRGVVAPCDAASEAQLSQYWIDQSVSVWWVAIPDDATFDSLNRTGLFDQFNEAFGTNIGDFEEDKIPPEHLDKAIRIVDALIKSSRLVDLHVIHRTRAVMDFARKNGTSVWFIL